MNPQQVADLIRAGVNVGAGVITCNYDGVNKLKTIIGDKVWLGDGVVVMPGVTIGEGSIIGANSVVTRDIGAFTIAAGAPARPLKEYDHERRMWRTASRSSSPKN